MSWQPIKTCPKDGSPFLACHAGGPVIYAFWQHGTVLAYDWRKGDIPTHWQPLPLGLPLDIARLEEENERLRKMLHGYLVGSVHSVRDEHPVGEDPKELRAKPASPSDAHPNLSNPNSYPYSVMGE